MNLNLENHKSNFLKAFGDLQRCWSTLAHNLTQHPIINNNTPSSISAHPPWARIAQNATRPFRRPMSAEEIEDRLDGIPVYALSNPEDEFMLVSGTSTGKNLGLFCFKKEDAESLLDQVTAIDPHMRHGSKVVPVALNKVHTSLSLLCQPPPLNYYHSFDLSTNIRLGEHLMKINL